jgi:hypothetical protein
MSEYMFGLTNKLITKKRSKKARQDRQKVWRQFRRADQHSGKYNKRMVCWPKSRPSI